MLFHSAEFLIAFLPAVFAVYLLLAHLKCKKGIVIWLTVASLAFYGWGAPQWLALITGSILANFLIGRIVCPNRLKLPYRLRLAIVIAGIGANLSVLAHFKYGGFLIENLNRLFRTDWSHGETPLPLALSFFTFTQIAYLVDTYRGETKRYTLLDYSFFVTFFPHLIAGPVVQHKEIMPQLEKDGAFRVRWDNLQVGLGIFGVGLFKKLVLGDGSGEYVSPFFRAAANGDWVSTPEAWIGILAYTFQIYFDFSGYSDMAIGLSRLFGIQLPLNFNSPYRSTSIIEFWRRWHISLSRFLRNYLYIPLGGNQRGTGSQYTNLIITMVLGGLWHGASWNFVIWGLLHGTFLVINHGFRSFVRTFSLGNYVDTRIGRATGWALTMLAVISGWVFFRAPDLPSAQRIFAMLFRDAQQVSLAPSLYSEGVPILWLCSMLIVCLTLPNTQEYFANYRPALDATMELGQRGHVPLRIAWSPKFRHGLVVGLLIFLGVQRIFRGAPSEFLYFNF
jgi:D-alanyl-lipoteichoic acid acyltransferase DltB (MBOAT superfamily)